MTDRRELGFTVVELSVALATMALVVAGTIGVLSSTTRTERGVRARVDALSELRGAIHQLTRDARQAVVIRGTSSRSHLDIDTLIDGVQTRVVYDAASGALTRAVGTGAAASILPGLTASDVFCYDSPTCAVSSPPAAVSVVRIALAARAASVGAPTVTVATEVRLRNAAAS